MKAKGSLLIVPLSHYQEDVVPEGSKADEWEERKADLLMKKTCWDDRWEFRYNRKGENEENNQIKIPM